MSSAHSGIVETLRALARREHDDLSIGDEAADLIEALNAALASKTASLEDATALYMKQRGEWFDKIKVAEATLAAEKERADAAEARAIGASALYDNLLTTWAESRKRHLTAEAARVKAEEVLRGYDVLSLVIESALREAESEFRDQLVAAVKAGRAALTGETP